MANLTIRTVDVGLAAARTPVTVTLTDADGNEMAANLISDGTAVVVPRTAMTAADGTLTLDLVAYTLITPSPIYYTVRIKGHSWLILKTAATQTLLEALAADPVAPTPTVLATKQDLAEKGEASGYASLDSSSRVVEDVVATELGLQVRGDTVREQIREVGTQTPVGTQLVVLGNSHDLGIGPNSLGTTASPALNSFANWLCWLSGGRWTMKRNGGVVGSTTAEMLANYETRAGQYQGDVLLVGGPTNDSALTPAESDANLAAIWALARADGMVPIQRLDPPRTDAQADRLSQANQLIRASALRKGVHVIDLARSFLVDASDGSVNTAYTYDPGVDDVHLSVAGMILAVQRLGLPVVDLLTPRAGGGLTLLPDWDDDPSNMLTKACFSAGITGNDPAGWDFEKAFGWSGTVTVSLEDPLPGEGIIGKWFRLDFTDWDGQCEMLQAIDPKPANGDRLFVDCVFEAECTGDLAIDIGLKSQGTYFGPICNWPAGTYPRSIPHTAPTMGAGASLSGAVHITGSGSNSGYLRLAQFGAYNFTALGLDDLWP